MAGQVALGVVALVRVGAAPLKPAGGQLVGRQGARPGGETGILMIMIMFIESSLKWLTVRPKSVA